MIMTHYNFCQIQHADISICVDHKLRHPRGVKKHFKLRSTASSLICMILTVPDEGGILGTKTDCSESRV